MEVSQGSFHAINHLVATPHPHPNPPLEGEGINQHIFDEGAGAKRARSLGEITGHVGAENALF
jgi:hypothetical protein